MSTFVESLQRLYQARRIEREKLDALLASNKITLAEYDYIISAKKVV